MQIIAVLENIISSISKCAYENEEAETKLQIGFDPVSNAVPYISG